jgi:hypothetical protein
MTKDSLPAEFLADYMTERGLVGQEGKSVVADRTASSVRSVERWLQYGIPKPKWALLQMNGK